jgi:hypothetical protein
MSRDALEVLVGRGRGRLSADAEHRLAPAYRRDGPAAFAAFKRVLELLDSYGEKVWVTRRIDIARCWQEQFPA